MCGVGWQDRESAQAISHLETNSCSNTDNLSKESIWGGPCRFRSLVLFFDRGGSLLGGSLSLAVVDRCGLSHIAVHLASL